MSGLHGHCGLNTAATDVQPLKLDSPKTRRHKRGYLDADLFVLRKALAFARMPSARVRMTPMTTSLPDGT